MFVCLFVCSLCTPRFFGGSSPNLVGVCRLTSHLPLRGSFSKRSTGQRVTFAFRYIIYAPASRHTLQRRLLLGKQQSLIRRPLLCCMSTTYVGGLATAIEGFFFSKVNGSTGQRVKRVTFTFTILYMIADDARLTPPRCKKHTGSMGRRVNRSNGSTGHFHFHSRGVMRSAASSYAAIHMVAGSRPVFVIA